MSSLQIAAVVALLSGAASWCGIIAFRRAPWSLAEARLRMSGAAPSGVASANAGDDWCRSMASSWFGRTLVARVESDLGIVGLTPADVVSRVLVSATILTFALVASLVALISMGVLPPSPLWWLACLVAGLVAGWVALRDVSARIDRRKLEVRQVTNDFIQLVAVGLTTDQSVEEAIRFAIAIGAGPAFEELRLEVLTAPQRGVPVWDAIDGLGVRYGVRELCEFASSVERQGLQGVSIGDSVSTLATAMRASALDRLEREADKANANLSGPTIGFVVTTIVFLAYPLAQRISDAFGG
ncbi:MAG: hypothetical protein WCI22_01525 [Actinomycetota bacterium]